MDFYKKSVKGKAQKFIALHLIITPEYLKYISKNQPDLCVYAVRLDRGLSPSDVLKTPPGKRWDEERGLDDTHYIVPGGGGFGEILNEFVRMTSNISDFSKLRVLKSAEEIKARVAEMGQTLTAKFKGQEPVAIGILNGSFIFFSDLIRAIDIDLSCEFLGVAAYRNLERIPSERSRDHP